MNHALSASLCVVALLCGGSTQAQEIAAPVVQATGPARVTVSPLRIEMDGPQRTETVRVINPSPRPIGVQVRIFNWDQENGEDVYSPSTELQVSPSIITIQPGDTQVFRLMRRELPPQGERRYRLAVDQLPDPALQRPGQATTRVRFTIPVFLDRASAAPAALAWSIEGNSLRLANTGQQTARMVNLALTGTAGDVPVEGFGLHYIMGGKQLSWDLPNGCPVGPIRMNVLVDGETVDAPVPVSCP